uniref:Uncharacterized protein n=1 Tax=mine drainage metagenome TaxID=410659 RepID=E6QW97_9ZZZZ
MLAKIGNACRTSVAHLLHAAYSDEFHHPFRSKPATRAGLELPSLFCYIKMVARHISHLPQLARIVAPVFATRNVGECVFQRI